MGEVEKDEFQVVELTCLFLFCHLPKQKGDLGEFMKAMFTMILGWQFSAYLACIQGVTLNCKVIWCH
jgi:hypothetical protein